LGLEVDAVDDDDDDDKISLVFVGCDEFCE
jgi:hypothetical protein